MAGHFFNVHDGISMPDLVGTEHTDIESARSEAVETIVERRVVPSLSGESKSSTTLVSLLQGPPQWTNVKTAQSGERSWPGAAVCGISYPVLTPRFSST
ncbi:DUF6894 family protein [Rhizobium leguminosarum]|jgi:hypothetical protein|uniref:DUF6894 family protein n=1 Tax=Rhizobium leguminosarum TaxID=384 RepID=UPI00391B9A01